MRSRMLLAAGLLLSASTVGAQDAPRRLTPEIRPFVGVFVPTGGLRDAFKSATTLGAQGAFELTRNVHLLGSVGWTHGHSKLVRGNDLTHIWQYDVGAEGNLVREMGGGWLFRPFLGAGAGARTYDYRAPGVGSRTCTAGYGSLGTEFQTGAMALRLEGRNYLSCYRAPLTGRNTTRSDLGLSLGVAYHLR